MRRMGRARATGESVDALAGLRRAGLTFGIGLACALSAPAVATAATTIHVNEKRESATFVKGGTKPADYNDSIDELSNDNGKCSLREAIEASNTDAAVDGCAAGDGPGDIVEMPAGKYHVYDNLTVLERVVIRGANAGTPGNDPGRGRETTITLDYNPGATGQPALFWLGAPSPAGPSLGGGSKFDGLTLASNRTSLCVAANLTGTHCENWAIVQPEKSGGTNTAPGLQLRNSIVRDLTAGVYLGGKGAVIKHNLFKDNDALMEQFPGASGVDVYSDGVYTNTNPHIVEQRIPQPEDRRRGVAGSPHPRRAGVRRADPEQPDQPQERGALFRRSPAQHTRTADPGQRDPGSGAAPARPGLLYRRHRAGRGQRRRDQRKHDHRARGGSTPKRRYFRCSQRSQRCTGDAQPLLRQRPRDPGVQPVSGGLARRPCQLVGSERRRGLEWRPSGCRQPGQRRVVRACRRYARGAPGFKLVEDPPPDPNWINSRRPTPARVLDARQHHRQHTGPADRARARDARCRPLGVDVAVVCGHPHPTDGRKRVRRAR